MFERGFPSGEGHYILCDRMKEYLPIKSFGVQSPNHVCSAIKWMGSNGIAARNMPGSELAVGV